MQRRTLGLLAALIVLGAGTAGAGLAAAVAGDSPAALETPSTPPEGPALWIRIDLRADGDAEWAIESRFNVTTPEQRAAFEDLVDDVRAGRTDPGYDRDLVEAYRDAAAVDREMAIRDVAWEDRVDNDTGVLAFTFTWTAFATVEDGEVRVGDVFLGEDGRPWLGAIDEGMRLSIDAPDGYSVQSSPPGKSVDDGRITWDGPAAFSPDDLSITYGGGGGSSPGVNWTAVGLLGALVVLAGGALLVGYRRTEDVELEGEDPEGEWPADEPAESPAEPEGRVDEELLSDPERVERLLEDHGGRMKQAMIVEETDWSTAKVSKLLSEMADDGRVEKLRIGQENLISLPSSAVDEPE